MLKVCSDHLPTVIIIPAAAAGSTPMGIAASRSELSILIDLASYRILNILCFI